MSSRDIRQLVVTTAVTLTAGAGLAAVVACFGVREPAALADVLRIFGCVVGVAAGLLFLLRWRVAGDAPAAHVGIGFTVMAAVGAPLTALAPLLHGTQPSGGLNPLTGAWIVGSAALPLFAAARSHQVDSGLRPVRLLLGWAAVAVAGGIGMAAAPSVSGRWPAPTTAQAATALVMFAGWLLLAARYAGRPSSLPTTDARWLASAFALFAATNLARLVAGYDSSWGALLAGVLSLTGVTLVALLAATGARQVLSAHHERMRMLAARLRTSESLVEAERDRLHDVRSTVAGIRCASGTLERYREELDALSRGELSAAIRSEIERLERLVSDVDADHEPRKARYDIDEVLRPLVVAYREQGLSLAWEPCRATMFGSADDLAEIVANLLNNALRHGRGAPSRLRAETGAGALVVTVADDGPGIPQEDRAQVFERGVRGRASGDVPGEGRGLHTARRLAREQGGDLELVASEPGCRFVLRLPTDTPDPQLPGQVRRQISSHDR
jgi:two-component system OmpR family sensor kinase